MECLVLLQDGGSLTASAEQPALTTTAGSSSLRARQISADKQLWSRKFYEDDRMPWA